MTYSLDHYQADADRFTNHDLEPEEEVMMCVLGIASESGEIAEAIKHSKFHGHELDLANLKKELGDLLWYLSKLSMHMGWPLSHVAKGNIEKLTKRYPTGFTSQDSINRIENATKT